MRTIFFLGVILLCGPITFAAEKSGACKVLADSRPVIFYIHPREIDPDQPRLRLNPVRRFKSYVNLNTTERKLQNILDGFTWTTIAEYLSENKNQLEND